MAFNKEDVAADAIRRFEQADGDRGTWLSHWEEIARRVWPNYADSFQSKGFNTPGQKRTEDMIDATAALALPKFASVMESMLTPANQMWHRLVPSDKALLRNRSARLWFDQVRDILFSYRRAPRANYQSQQHEAYLSLGAFGTGVLFVDPLDPRYGGGLRYRAIHLSEVVFLENHQGIIDTALRKFELTARQAMQKFGDAVPKRILDAAGDQKKRESKFWFIHCIKPRSEEEGYNPGRLDVKGMEYASYYVSVEEKVVVREGGYNTFPYAISRYVQAPGELYGRSPAMLALPAIKVLNEQKKTVLKQGHRAVDPVLLAHDDGVVDSFSLKPGAMNFGGVSADGRPLVHALPVGNLALAREMMEAEARTINDAFLITLFQILTENPQMTATEVIERTREKGMLLGPTMGRQQAEALGPMIDRELDVLAMQGFLPEMPPILKEARGEYNIEYDSPLSRAMKSEQAAGLMRTTEYALSVINVTQDPSILDSIDYDVALPEIADIQGVPERWKRSSEGIAAVRQQRAQQAQMAQAVEALPAVSGLMKAAPNAR